MLKFRNLHKAERDDIGDLVTFRVMPTSTLEMGQLDPFLFLNHHGPQFYPPHNRGLPFSPHPHRGFETVTYIRTGELVHRDSGGYSSQIFAGGVQWMTAGRGLIHEEVSSLEFKAKGGELEILQLWVNLPASLKMTEPAYKGMQKDEIRRIDLPDHAGSAEIISGTWFGQSAHYQSLTHIGLVVLNLKAHASLTIPLPAGERVFFYVIQGVVTVNRHDATDHQVVEFEDGEGNLELDIHAQTDACVYLATGQPTREPIAAHGPFVMNKPEEIHQAIRDFQAGKFGTWPEG
ncbi:MAG: pirin family protein [Bdellovibrionota bacterium]